MIRVTLYLIILYTLCYRATTTATDSSSNDNRILNIPTDRLDYGARDILADKTVYFSALSTEWDTYSDHNYKIPYTRSEAEQQHAMQLVASSEIPDPERSVQSLLSIDETIMLRRKMIAKLQKHLPMVITQWPMINTSPCPHFLSSIHSHRTEHSLGISHMQMWLEFLFFDNDVIDAMHRPTPEFIVSTTYSSVSGIFEATKNGSLFKNGIPFLDDDILVVIEDSAERAVEDLTTALKNELQEMDVDMVTLGWYNHELWHTNQKSARTGDSRINNYDHGSYVEEGDVSNYKKSSEKQVKQKKKGNKHKLRRRMDELNNSNSSIDIVATIDSNSHRYLSSTTSKLGGEVTANMPTFAYAITRRGARKLVEYYDQCGKPLAEQLKHLVLTRRITHRFANRLNYKDNLRLDWKPSEKSALADSGADISEGIFHQRRRMVVGF